MSVSYAWMGWINNTASVIAIYYPCLTYGAVRSTVWRERDRFESDKKQKVEPRDLNQRAPRDFFLFLKNWKENKLRGSNPRQNVNFLR